MKRLLIIPSMVLSLGLGISNCFAHGHGGGGGGHMGGGHHMGGMSMGGHHMGGHHVGGGHHMGGFQTGGHHMGQMGGHHYGGTHHGGGSYYSPGGIHHGGQTFSSGRSTHHQFNRVSPGISAGTATHGRSHFSGGQYQYQPGHVTHQGLQHHNGLQHHSGQLNSGSQLHHHHQFQPQSGTALGSRQGIQNGIGNQFGAHSMHHHHQTGTLQTGTQQRGLNGSAGTAVHHSTARISGATSGIANSLQHHGHHQNGLQHHGHHQNSLQQAQTNLSQQPRGVSARHAALSNHLSSFHHGHHHTGISHGNAGGVGNGINPGQNSHHSSHHDHHPGQGGLGHHGNGNWNGHGNGHGHHHDWHHHHQRRYWPYYGWYTGFWNPGFGYGYGNVFGYGRGFGYGLGYGYGSIYNSYPGWAAFGLTPWGINRQAWTFGYWNYNNPYCYTGVGVSSPYNYAQPLVTYQQQVPGLLSGSGTNLSADPKALPPGVTEEGKQAFDQALAEFRVGDSVAALAAVDHAIQQMPTDAVAHEFRSLVLFSLGRYDEAAEVIYAVLAVGPGWDWETMSSLYGNPQDYTTQLRALESYIGEHLNSSPARFLLAYHYMRCGHNDAAKEQLKRVLEITPGNKVATDLLSVMEGPEAAKSVPGATEPVAPTLPPLPDDQDAAQNASEMKPEQLTGNWKATGPDGTKFQLVLNADSTFKWTFSREGKSEDVSGVWAIQGGTLALEPDAGGNMIGDVVLKNDRQFNFRMVGAVKEDPGLNFEKTTQQ